MVAGHPFRARRLARSALALAIGMGFTGLAFAQATTGSLFGQAPSGDTVTVKSASGLTRTLPVDASGRFSTGSLPVGAYTVTLKDSSGAIVDTRNDVVITVGTGTQVILGGASSQNAQAVEGLTVTANSLPSIDVSSVNSRTVITSQQLQQLPLGRNAEAIALLAPGAAQGSSYFKGPGGTDLVSFGGASVTENAYYINGMNVTDPINGLGGISLPYGSIDQEQILTGGYGAQYGRSTGGVINQVGKRGTNEWHFGGQILFTPKWGQADPVNQHYPNGSIYRYRNNNKSWTTVEDAYIGGPLIKDKLFLFASVEGEKSSGNGTPASTTRTGTGTITSGTDVRTEYHDPKYYTKLDWNIDDNNILELTSAGTKHEYNGGVYDYDYDTHNRGDYMYADTHTKVSSKMWIAKYTGYLTDNLTLTAQYGKQKTEHYSELGNFDPDLVYILNPDRENPAYTGGASGGIGNNQTVDTTVDPANEARGANYRIDLTYVLGDHTISAGIDNQRTQDLDAGEYIPTNANYLWEYDKVETGDTEILKGRVAAPGGDGYYVDQYRYLTSASIRVEQRAQYIQDEWQVNDRWLLSLGLRNDQFTNYNPDNQPYINQHKPQWAPRLGFSWDVFGDSSFKVYGNAGRYYLALPTSVALRGASGSLYTRTYYTYTGVDENGYPMGLQPIQTENGLGAPVSENNEYGQAPDPKTVASKTLKSEYQDEYILGFDKTLNMLDTKWVYGAKATYRKLGNLIDDTCNFQAIESAAKAQGVDVTNLHGCYFINPGRAADFLVNTTGGGYEKVHLNAEQLGLPKAKRSYYSLELYLQHPFDGTWWGKVDYQYARSYGNTEGQVRSDIGQSDISATVDWDYPSLMAYSNGTLSNDRKHTLKLYGGYAFNSEWSVSGNVLIASGAPRSCLGGFGADQGHPAYTGDYYHFCNGEPSPPGDEGRAPWQHIYSVQAEYRPAFADHKLGFSVDLYNIFNEQHPLQYQPQQHDARFNEPLYYETPRYVRFGITYDF